MKLTPETATTGPITGHAFILDPDHCVAIYERKGEAWVAEFHGSRSELTHASAWFRSEVGGQRYRRLAYRPAAALTPKLVESIERLHGEDQPQKRRRRIPGVLGSVARRCGTCVMTAWRASVGTGRASVE